MLPTIDIPEPMQERVSAFAVGSRLGGGCSTTDWCCCTVLPTISAAFDAMSLSFSGALLLNILTPCARGIYCQKGQSCFLGPNLLLSRRDKTRPRYYPKA